MTRAELVPFAEAELASRESAYPGRIRAGTISADEGGRTLAAWRAIVTLLRDGSVPLEPCLGERPADAWQMLVAQSVIAADYRFGRAVADGSEDSCRRSAAAREIRSLLVRSAIRQGAEVPTFDDMETK